jgi:hypothetical protein
MEKLMSDHELYLKTNRHFSAKAELMSLDKKDALRTHETFLIYLANIDTLLHLAEGMLGYIAVKLLDKAVDDVAEKTVRTAWGAAKKAAAQLTSLFRKESHSPQIDYQDKQYDEITSLADDVLPVLLDRSAHLSPEALDQALAAGRQAAQRFMLSELSFPEKEAEEVAAYIQIDLRAAITHRKTNA